MRTSACALIASSILTYTTVSLAYAWGSASLLHTLYFINNDPAGNYVVAASIDANGLPTGSSATHAGGVGVHGMGSFGLGPDGTFSQGIVQVHQDNDWLATVNTANHTVVLFGIDPYDPLRLTMIGKPVSTQGDSPNSVAFNDAGNRLCVLNTGTTNGIACFDVTKTGLVLQEESVRSLGLALQTVPATGPFNTASQIVFTRDQKNILVAVKGTPTEPGFFAVWPINESTGQLAEEYTRIPAPPGGGLPFSLKPIPGTDSFVGADFAIGYDIIEFNKGATDLTARTKALPIEGQVGACWSTYSAARDSYYIVDVAGVVTEVKVDTQLRTSTVNNFTVPAPPIDSVALDIGRKSYFYTLLPTLPGLGVWDLDAKPAPEMASIVSLATLTQDLVPLTPGYVQGMAAYTHKV
ncbi:unnamed protein product [Peniophora sp. CBMAI 1063]|nr:unnamed protein product [Peniophora sp. CBMAI 1063]